MQVVRVSDDLPDGFAVLRAEARSEGVRHMDLLAEQWPQSDLTLFAAYTDGELAGVGGVSPEASEPAMRMRRLYVRPAYRRCGVGRALAGAMMQEGLQSARVLTCNARASEAAGPFWEEMGFEAVEAEGYTHRFAS